MTKIRQKRIESGYTIKHISDSTGIPYRTLQDWDNGNRRPSDLQQLKKLAEFYKCSIEELI